MHFKKMPIAAGVGWLAMQIAALAIHEVLLGDYFADAISEEVRLPVRQFAMVDLGRLILSLLMSYAYPLFIGKTGRRVWDGFRFGVLIGSLWRLPYAVMETGLYRFTPMVSLVDSVAACVEVIIGGIVIAAVYGRPKASTPNATALCNTGEAVLRRHRRLPWARGSQILSRRSFDYQRSNGRGWPVFFLRASTMRLRRMLRPRGPRRPSVALKNFEVDV